MSELERVRAIFRTYAQDLERASTALQKDQLARFLDLARKRRGKFVVVGVGKSGDIGKKIASTLSSYGLTALFLHPSDAMHGDLGLVSEGDLVIAISHSGETPELVSLLPYLKKRGAPIVAITGRAHSTLANHAQAVFLDAVEREACPLNLAPTSSTLVALAIGDALAILMAEQAGVTQESFARNHPSGRLGKRLTLTVSDLMLPMQPAFSISPDTPLMAVTQAITQGGCGATCVIDHGKVIGIVTDGDIRRALQSASASAVLSLTARQVMTANPTQVSPDELAVKALDLMENRPSQISVIPVIDSQTQLRGMLRLHDLVRSGL